MAVEALPRVREGLLRHLKDIQAEAKLSTSSLKRRVDAIKRDRYKWAERDMHGSVPSDIGREKQDQLARQLASLEHELAGFDRGGIDSERTLSALLDRLGNSGLIYRDLDEQDRRHYNQAWFTRIYIDAVDTERDGPRAAGATRTDLASAMDDSRHYVEAVALRMTKRTP